MANPRKERLPKNVTAFVDRHGRLRYRFRKTGHATHSFAHHPNSPEGKRELADHLAGVKPRPGAGRHAHGTVGWAAARYFASAAFLGAKNPQTQRTAHLILDKFVVRFAPAMVADFRFDHIEAVLLDAAQPRSEDGPRGARRRGGPSAASNLRGELKPFFDYAHKVLGVEKPNPVDQAAPIAVPKGGFHSWTEEEIAQYRARWPLGTMARLAAEIVLWTWQRRGDAATFGRKHVKDGKYRVTHAKTGKVGWLPFAPQLEAAIDAMPLTGTGTYLVTSFGKPFSKAGLGNKMRAWCDAAGLPHCTMHGLRKAAARRAADLGASQQGLKAVGMWSGDHEVATYVADADQARLAATTLNAVIAFDLANPDGTK